MSDHCYDAESSL